MSAFDAIIDAISNAGPKNDRLREHIVPKVIEMFLNENSDYSENE